MCFASICLDKSGVRLDVWPQSKHRQRNPPKPSDSFSIFDLIRAAKQTNSNEAHPCGFSVDVSLMRECLDKFCCKMGKTRCDARHV